MWPSWPSSSVPWRPQFRARRRDGAAVWEGSAFGSILVARPRWVRPQFGGLAVQFVLAWFSGLVVFRAGVCVWCASGVDSYGLRIRVCEGWFRAPGGLPSGALVMRVPLLGLSGWVPLLGISGCVPLLGLSGWVPLLGLSGYPLGRVSVWKVWVTKGTLGEGWVSFGSLSGATGWVPQGTLGVGLGVLRGGSPPPRCWGPLLGLLGSLAYDTRTIPCRAESARVNVSCA